MSALFTFVSQLLQAFQPLTFLIFCSTFWRSDLSRSCLKMKSVSAYTIMNDHIICYSLYFKPLYLLRSLSRDLCLRRLLIVSLDLLLLLLLLWRLLSLLASLTSLSSSLLILSLAISDLISADWARPSTGHTTHNSAAGSHPHSLFIFWRDSFLFRTIIMNLFKKQVLQSQGTRSWTRKFEVIHAC